MFPIGQIGGYSGFANGFFFTIRKIDLTADGLSGRHRKMYNLSPVLHFIIYPSY